MHPIVSGILANHETASMPDSAEIEKMVRDFKAALADVAAIRKTRPPSDNPGAIRTHENSLALAEDRATSAQDHLQRSLTEFEHGRTADPHDVARLRQLAGLSAK